MFPETRLRRLRRNQNLRNLLRENTVTMNDLIYPIFVEEGIDAPVPISSMPGISREPEGVLADRVRELAGQGIKALMLFGVSRNKDADGSDTWDDNGLLARMTRTVKEAGGDMTIFADVCF